MGVSIQMKDKKFTLQNGFTIVELIVTMGIISVVFLGLLVQYTQGVKAARDLSIRNETYLQAQAVLQMVCADIRTLGNGVPFELDNFQIGEITLSDPTITEPIDVATAASNYLKFRLNESGEVAVLTANYDPAASFQVNLTSVDGLAAGETIYISNAVVSGEDGLYATISSVDTANDRITLNNDIDRSPSSTFDMGSTLEEIRLIIYRSEADGSAIYRSNDNGTTEILLAEDGTVGFEYIKHDNTILTPPITNSNVVNDLRSIRVTVNITSDQPLSDGSTYTATTQQVVGLRNLTYAF